MDNCSTIVGIHTYDQKQPNHQPVMIGKRVKAGDNEYRYLSGRLTKALAVFLEEVEAGHDANLVIFMSSVVGPDGKNEAEVARELMLSSIPEMLTYSKVHPVFDFYDVVEVEELLADSLVMVDDESIVRPGNTTEFMQACEQLIDVYCGGECRKLILVSSCDHVPRVYRDAFKRFGNRLEIAGILDVQGSLYPYGPSGEVVIYETPVSSSVSSEIWNKIPGIVRNAESRSEFETFIQKL